MFLRKTFSIKIYMLYYLSCGRTPLGGKFSKLYNLCEQFRGKKSPALGHCVAG